MERRPLRDWFLYAMPRIVIITSICWCGVVYKKTRPEPYFLYATPQNTIITNIGWRGVVYKKSSPEYGIVASGSY